MTDQPLRRAFSRPPVDGTDEEWETWADDFADALLGPTPADEGRGDE